VRGSNQYGRRDQHASGSRDRHFVAKPRSAPTLGSYDTLRRNTKPLPPSIPCSDPAHLPVVFRIHRADGRWALNTAGSASPSLSRSNFVVADSGNTISWYNSDGRASNLVDVLNVAVSIAVINSGGRAPVGKHAWLEALRCRTPAGGILRLLINA